MNILIKTLMLLSGIKNIVLCTIFLNASILIIAQSKKPLCDFVDPFIGTQEMGHTFPGATVPFGMVQLSPETDTVQFLKDGKYNAEVYRYCAGYEYSDKTIVGFAHTHMSGTGHSDLGDFLLMPTTGKLKLFAGNIEKTNNGYRSGYNHKTEVAKPGYYSVVLDDYKIKAEMTATTHVGMHQYTFPKSDSSHILLDMNYGIYNYDGKVLWSYVRVENDTLVTGYRITNGWARTRYVYFAMTFSKPIKKYGYKNFEKMPYKGFWRKFNQEENFPEMAGKNVHAWFDFSTNEDEKIKIKFALSSVSTEGALKNLKAETPDWDFENIKLKANNLWEKELNKIVIDGSDEKKVSFYTSMYHAFLSPITYMDVDSSYRGLDNNIHKTDKSTNYTVFSLWDTYRALHPLFTIIQPKRDNDMIISMLSHYDQSAQKFLPVWSHYGNENWCMIGYHSVSVIADAYLKGIRSFDVNKAFEAMVATANHKNYEGIGQYIQYGYVPFNLTQNSASLTLEYAYDDWAISRFASAIGKTEEAKVLINRALQYKNLFDKQTGFIRAKDSKGGWKSPFNPMHTVNEGYIEGNAWNYSFYVPQDIDGYIHLLGGNKKLINKLDSLFILQIPESEFKESEDIEKVGIIGNYVHGNEPSHHIAYLYNWAGAPWKTQEKIHLIVGTKYKPTPDGLCGNDDCGQMSAWYIFSVMGFYPVCPGSNQYVIGSPCVNESTITLDGNRKFIIRAKSLSNLNIYIQSVTLNGKPWNKTYINHEDIINGGEIIFTMGPKPNKQWGTSIDSKPYSISVNEKMQVTN